jgi:hypothetical protein
MRRWLAVLFACFLVLPLAALAQSDLDIPEAVADLESRVTAIEKRLDTRPLGTQRANGLRISGNGDSVSEPFALEAGTALFTMRMRREGDKSVDLLSAPGTEETAFSILLFPQSEPYDGTVAEPILIPGQYVLEVAAEGQWVVFVEQ